MTPLQTALDSALESMRISITPAQLDAFEQYYDLLLAGNARTNLTTIVEAGAVAEKHFADSLLAMEHIPEGARCIDVGTGAGFPGIPLLIMREDISMLLLDSLGKRVAFLRETVQALGLSSRAQYLHDRAEDAARQHRGQYDVVLSRAVAALPVLLEYTLPFCRVGGLCIAYKGNAAEELAAAENALGVLGGEAELIEAGLPWGARSLVLVRKVAKTPREYPRRSGVPAKQPL